MKSIWNQINLNYSIAEKYDKPIFAMAQHGGGMDIAGIRVEFILLVWLYWVWLCFTSKNFCLPAIGLAVIAAFKPIFVPEYSFCLSFFGRKFYGGPISW